MMSVFYIEATKDTPKIYFDPAKGIFEISQKSLPEDAIGFFRPVFDYLNQYIDHPNKETNFTFFLDYFSTSTAKQISKIMFLLEKLSERSKVKVIWKFERSDIDMKNVGKRFKNMVNVDFELVEV